MPPQVNALKSTDSAPTQVARLRAVDLKPVTPKPLNLTLTVKLSPSLNCQPGVSGSRSTAPPEGATMMSAVRALSLAAMRPVAVSASASTVAPPPETVSVTCTASRPSSVLSLKV